MSLKDTHHNNLSLWAIHVLTWSFLGYLFLLRNPLMEEGPIPIELWMQQIGRLLLLVIVFYTNNKWMYDFTFRKKNYSGFVAWIVAAVVILNFLSIGWSHILNTRQALISIGKPPPPEENYFDGFMIITTLMVLGISTSMAAIKHSQNDEWRREEAEKQRVVSELGQLKAQINPHFFFNTLNNIYALSYIDIEESRKTIQKLSRMMRYVIYETQPDKVPIYKELDFVDNYISLMRLRLSENTKLDYETSYDSKEDLMAPMILLSFIENAFKHGISSIHSCHISIHIHSLNHKLTLLVENDIYPQELAGNDHTGGIGLENTIRRLDLLYNGQYSLNIDNKNYKYIVKLNINL